jgi:hypothetical protein
MLNTLLLLEAVAAASTLIPVPVRGGTVALCLESRPVAELVLNLH